MTQKRFWIIALVIVLLDQILKNSIRSAFELGESLPIINNILHITYVQNTGVAFGLFKGVNFLFIIVALIAIGVILYCYKKYNKIITKNTLLILSTSFLLGGAIGNLLDRIFLGFVVDFIDFRIWPAFNIADSALTIGVILLLWYSMKN